MEHYRCVRCYIPDTHAEVDTDTVQYFPHHASLSETTTADVLRKAALDILTLLKHHHEFLPSLEEIAKRLRRDEVVPSQTQQEQVAHHLHEALHPPTPAPTPEPTLLPTPGLTHVP